MAKHNWISSAPNNCYRVASMALIVSGAFGLITVALSEEATPDLAATGSSGQGAGSSVLEDVVVTATRRSESIQDVPMSISAVSQADLEKAGATELQDVVNMVPGVAYTQNSVGQAVIAIRGVQTSALTGNVQQPVSIYYDDVPVLDLTVPWTVPALELFDVNRVEVLRGPQGTLFGAGSLSGALRVSPTSPTCPNSMLRLRIAQRQRTAAAWAARRR